MARPRRISQQVVAEAAGVSRMTVSLALRNAPRIPRETRERIQRIASELGYHGDPELSRLRSRVRTIGHADYREPIAVVFSDFGNPANPTSAAPFTHRVLAGMSDHAERLGCRCERFFIEEPSGGPRHLLGTLRARGIRAVFAAPLPWGRREFLMDVADFSAVTMAYSISSPDLHRVCPNHFQAMIVATEQLTGLGYERIGFVQYRDLEWRLNHKWAAAFLAYQAEIPRKRRVPILHVGDQPKNRVSRWLQQYRPDVVVGGYPIALYDHLTRDMGVAIPEDLGYLHMLSADVRPGVSYLNQNETEIGAAVLDMLMGQLHRDERGVPSIPRTAMVDATWVPGSTLRTGS